MAEEASRVADVVLADVIVEIVVWVIMTGQILPPPFGSREQTTVCLSLSVYSQMFGHRLLFFWIVHFT